jgi:hypothetical protein
MDHTSMTSSTTLLGSERSHKLAATLEDSLPSLARDLIPKLPENARFLQEPDHVEEHFPDWHQYGIITHTKRVRECFLGEFPALLESWQLSSEVQELFLQTPNGNWTKGELFEISIPLHDLGKFTRRHATIKGKLVQDYTSHEALSRIIVLSNPIIRETLRTHGLRDAEVAHVAELAGLHFELGKVRDIAKQNNGYTIEFAKGPKALETYREIIARYPTCAAEIGLWLIVDSMGKMSLRLEAENDLEREAAREQKQREIQETHLQPALINAVIQYPVNMHVGREYLREALLRTGVSPE